MTEPTDAASHYRSLLADHYGWMLGGDVERLAAEDRLQLERLDLALPSPARDAVAVDLGCGHGPQTLALADMGFGTVIAVDSSRELLDELSAHAGSRPAVRTVHGDLVDVLPDVAPPSTVSVAVCMRDTLLHLPDTAAVDRLFTRTATALAPGGTLVLSYRDLTRELHGTDRFLPVRADGDRIMVCVRDTWELHKSSYRKLRLGADEVAARLSAAGLRVVEHAVQQGGMWRTVARRAS